MLLGDAKKVTENIVKALLRKDSSPILSPN
jgi:hypothetical protein